MHRYEDFGFCTRRALVYTARVLNAEISEEEQEKLIEEYQNPRPFPDVIPGIEALKEKGHTLVAFSNGAEVTASTLLDRAGMLPHLEGVISVDDYETFKPDPQVYNYLVRHLNTAPEETWLVSINPWDIIETKNAGLRAAWIQGKPDAQFDPWDLEPDLVAPDLQTLAKKL